MASTLQEVDCAPDAIGRLPSADRVNTDRVNSNRVNTERANTDRANTDRRSTLRHKHLSLGLSELNAAVTFVTFVAVADGFVGPRLTSPSDSAGLCFAPFEW